WVRVLNRWTESIGRIDRSDQGGWTRLKALEPCCHYYFLSAEAQWIVEGNILLNMMKWVTAHLVEREARNGPMAHPICPIREERRRGVKGGLMFGKEEKCRGGLAGRGSNRKGSGGGCLMERRERRRPSSAVHKREGGERRTAAAFHGVRVSGGCS
ncbi:hypothetical protein LINPERPRIM_LOCUS1906, partial [Linum perenne]